MKIITGIMAAALVAEFIMIWNLSGHINELTRSHLTLGELVLRDKAHD